MRFPVPTAARNQAAQWLFAITPESSRVFSCCENETRWLVRASGKPLPPSLWMGREGCHLLCIGQTLWYSAGSLASSQGKVHLNLRLDLDRFAVQQIRLVFPLFDGLNGCGRQHRMPADQLKVCNTSFLADLRLQDYHALNARLPRQRRIRGLHPANQQALRNALGYPYPLRSGDLRNSHRSGADNSSNHATHGTARNTTGNAAHHASRSHRRGWSFVLLNHLNFFRNLGWCAQLTIHDVGLNLLYHVHRRGCRWRRRWRWWRCH